MFKVNKKDSRLTSLMSFWCLCCSKNIPHLSLVFLLLIWTINLFSGYKHYWIRIEWIFFILLCGTSQDLVIDPNIKNYNPNTSLQLPTCSQCCLYITDDNQMLLYLFKMAWKWIKTFNSYIFKNTLSLFGYILTVT